MRLISEVLKTKLGEPMKSIYLVFGKKAFVSNRAVDNSVCKIHSGLETERNPGLSGTRNCEKKP